MGLLRLLVQLTDYLVRRLLQGHGRLLHHRVREVLLLHERSFEGHLLHGCWFSHLQVLSYTCLAEHWNVWLAPPQRTHRRRCQFREPDQSHQEFLVVSRDEGLCLLLFQEQLLLQVDRVHCLLDSIRLLRLLLCGVACQEVWDARLLLSGLWPCVASRLKAFCALHLAV